MRDAAAGGWLGWIAGMLLAGLIRGQDLGGRADVPLQVRDALEGRPTGLVGASVRELRALPGLGERRANAVVRAGWDGGPGALRLDAIHGIGPVTAERVGRALARRRAARAGPIEIEPVPPERLFVGGEPRRCPPGASARAVRVIPRRW